MDRASRIPPTCDEVWVWACECTYAAGRKRLVETFFFFFWLLLLLIESSSLRIKYGRETNGHTIGMVQYNK